MRHRHERCFFTCGEGKSPAGATPDCRFTQNHQVRPYRADPILHERGYTCLAPTAPTPFWSFVFGILNLFGICVLGFGILPAPPTAGRPPPVRQPWQLLFDLISAVPDHPLRSTKTSGTGIRGGGGHGGVASCRLSVVSSLVPDSWFLVCACLIRVDRFGYLVETLFAGARWRTPPGIIRVIRSSVNIRDSDLAINWNN